MNNTATETERPMFADARVGDRVWSVLYGWGEVVEFNSPLAGQYPLGVEHIKRDYIAWYTLDGVYVVNASPILFWDEVKIVPPPRPKRKVTKTLEGWVHVFSDGKIGCFFTNGQQALASRGSDESVRVIRVSGPYEVEE